MGASIAGILCELTGHVEGVARGKGGSMVSWLDQGLARSRDCLTKKL
jgi:TPP-dependent pyruvate/acetoin dehydrogenase alpha subunit